MYFDRIRDTTIGTGTTALTLAGVAPTGFLSAATVPVGTQLEYVVLDPTSGAVEVGRGLLSAGLTLNRNEVLRSSNSDALVNFGAGTKEVFLTVSARSVQYNGKSMALTQDWGVS